ncbi:hypothetical protein NP233_g10425 [Leucocoprinus birnbaumii]|uniref:Uncharacterized protein n=1 Tax=Leucocoprinus birnbaumii TaxID=56174 RepID=A0AAD5YRW3_9AGAR|nr:hypothetical protein NP233_g10425 [Leucocoprinus birnbaumii]
MEATFDNKTNLISCNVRSCVDSSVLYNISTTHNLWGRTVTLLKDANPTLGANSPIVGAIYWRERLFEVNGHRKSISDIKRKPPGFVAANVQPQPKSRSGGKHRRSHSRSRAKDESKKKRERSRDARTTHDKEKKPNSRSKPANRRKNEPEPKDQIIAVPTPGCTSCLGFTRRSSIFFSQIGLGDWWRSVTCSTRYWRWSADRTEYELSYHHEQWKVCLYLLSFSIITSVISFVFVHIF